jgi:hypothetical protein
MAIMIFLSYPTGNDRASATAMPPRKPPQVIIISVLRLNLFLKANKRIGVPIDTNRESRTIKIAATAART